MSKCMYVCMCVCVCTYGWVDGWVIECMHACHVKALEVLFKQGRSTCAPRAMTHTTFISFFLGSNNKV